MERPRIAILDLVKAARRGRCYEKTRVPLWMHLQATADILEWAFAGTQEVTDERLRDDLYVAAVGHDLYRDGPARREDIAEKFGTRVDEWIHGMATGGDGEEVRLIDLAELVACLATRAHAIPDQGLSWTRHVLLPIATKRAAALRKAPFARYRRTAEVLRGYMELLLDRLQSNVAMFMSDARVSTVDAVFEAVDAENAAALAMAEDEAKATGKEPFSLSRLEDAFGEALSDREASLRMRYYVRHPEIRTLAAFAEHLRAHEVWG